MEESLSEFLQCFYLPGRAAAYECPDLERSDPAVVAGLAQSHVQVVGGREVVDVVAHPADVERLAFDGAGAHLPDDVEHRQLGGVVQHGVAHHDGADQAERVIAGVDGQRFASWTMWRTSGRGAAGWRP